ncbi:VanZ family protein [Arthrobacter sp. Sa2BUA2]|uniref:VanZ family protein n=1 Tax=Arthrobacter pullicola TaxID=2762224 RepID=A0ABR8YFS0_9MICC|nr:VanZ family protein [Arthrobacter pullicola]MBD8043079.1 VanZ family protein [Arthrobacter pullicola]
MVLWLCAVGAAGVVTAILLNPTPVDRPVYGHVLKALAWLQARGVPSWVTYDDVERLANVALFILPGLLVSLLLARKRWWLALALCLGLSAAMELAQHLFLPERSASSVDVLLNGAGALIGVLLGSALRNLGAARRLRRTCRQG